MVKSSPAMQETQETQIQSLGKEDPFQEGMQPTPILAKKIPWTEEPGGFAKSQTWVKQLNTHATMTYCLPKSLHLKEHAGIHPGTILGTKVSKTNILLSSSHSS